MSETAYRGNPEIISTSRRVNAFKRYRDDDDPVVVEAEADHQAAVARDAVQRIVDAWPPLSADVLGELQAILSSGPVLDATGLLNSGEQ